MTSRQDEVWAFRLDGPPSKHINWQERNPAILLSDEAAERAPTAFDDDPEVSLLWACMWICGIAYVTRIAMCTEHFRCWWWEMCCPPSFEL